MNSFDFASHPFTSKLQNVKSLGTNKWMASCPCSSAHKNGDKKQSLSIAFDSASNKILIKCQTGCRTEDVCSALGCSISDLFMDPNENNMMRSISWYANKKNLRYSEYYDYGDGYYKVRFYEQNGEKTFAWLHKDPSKRFGYTWNKSGFTNRLYVAGTLHDENIILAEGEKDANTVHRLTGLTGVSAENGATKGTAENKWMAEYDAELTGKKVFILFDADEAGIHFKDIEVAHLIDKAKSVLVLDIRTVWADCPEHGDISDMAVALGDSNTTNLLLKLIDEAEPINKTGSIAHGENNTDLPIHEAVELIQDPEPEWEPLAKGKGLPQFPLNRLPYWVQEHINGFSATTGVSKDYCASAVLGAISSVVVGHIDVLFNGTHREPVQLYSCFVGSSGTMKSSVINHFMKPATEWLRKNNDLTRKTNYAVEKQIEDLERSISAEQKSGKKRDQGKVKDLVEQLNQKRQERHNNFPLPWDDVTPESLINAMKFSRGTANIATAEGNIINVITGRSYTQRGAVQNIDVFLKGSDGESIHQNRITSGETDIPRADISMLLAIQPGLLERLCKSPDAVGRGLAQRFLVYAPEDENKTIDHSIPIAMDPEHMQRWTEHIEYIASRYMDPDQPAKLMELDADADKTIRQFWNYEAELIRERGSADEDSITGWLAKCHGKAIRVSALLALLRDKNAMTITGQDAENAVELFKEYYIPMFIASYERPDFLTQAERMIVNWIIRHHNHVDGHDSFSQRDIWIDLRQRTIFTGKPGAEQFTEALEQLQERNYIRPMLSKRTSSGRGRPAKEWLVNPEVFKK